MTLQDLFDTLLLERKALVQIDKSGAESLRIQLVKKWNKYKVELDALGFLAADLQDCSICRRNPETEGGPYQFFLMPRRKHKVEYTIVTPEQTKHETV